MKAYNLSRGDYFKVKLGEDTKEMVVLDKLPFASGYTVYNQTEQTVVHYDQSEFEDLIETDENKAELVSNLDIILCKKLLVAMDALSNAVIAASYENVKRPNTVMIPFNNQLVSGVYTTKTGFKYTFEDLYKAFADQKSTTNVFVNINSTNTNIGEARLINGESIDVEMSDTSLAKFIKKSIEDDEKNIFTVSPVISIECTDENDLSTAKIDKLMGFKLLLGGKSVDEWSEEVKNDFKNKVKDMFKEENIDKMIDDFDSTMTSVFSDVSDAFKDIFKGLHL